MKLFEIITGAIGESYVRAYAWAESEERACSLFEELHPKKPVKRIRPLFSATEPEFCTLANDHGWPDDVDLNVVND